MAVMSGYNWWRVVDISTALSLKMSCIKSTFSQGYVDKQRVVIWNNFFSRFILLLLVKYMYLLSDLPYGGIGSFKCNVFVMLHAQL